jgi:hypothetical protein
MLLEKSYLECGGLVGECARATQEHISVNDEQKIAALDGVHDVLEHRTLQHAFQPKASRTENIGGRYDTEIKAAFRSQDLSC